MKTLRMIAGTLIWCALVSAAVCWATQYRVADGTLVTRLGPDLWKYASGREHVVDIELEGPSELEIGDPVFVIDGPDGIRQVGQVRRLSGDGSASAKGQVMFYASAPELREDATLTYHQTPDSMAWVLQTMLPAEKRAQVSAEIQSVFLEHRREVLDALRPVVERSLSESLTVLEEDLPASIRGHQREFEALGVKYEEEIVRKELVPLVRQEVWPIVRRHAEPLATEVGKEMWDRASVWRFGWRYVYDKTWRPDDSLVQREWERFVAEEAVPILESHSSDFVAVQQKVLADAARNDEVKQAVRRNMAKLVHDEELREVIWSVVQETIVNNPRMKEVIHRNWTSPEAQEAFQLASRRLEPTVVRIGHLLFGDEQSGISPEFALVLRHEILGKDRRWLVLQSGRSARPAGATLQVRRGEAPDVNPFHQLAFRTER